MVEPVATAGAVAPAVMPSADAAGVPGDAGDGTMAILASSRRDKSLAGSPVPVAVGLKTRYPRPDGPANSGRGRPGQIHSLPIALRERRPDTCWLKMGR